MATVDVDPPPSSLGLVLQVSACVCAWWHGWTAEVHLFPLQCGDFGVTPQRVQLGCGQGHWDAEMAGGLSDHWYPYPAIQLSVSLDVTASLPFLMIPRHKQCTVFWSEACSHRRLFLALSLPLVFMGELWFSLMCWTKRSSLRPELSCTVSHKGSSLGELFATLSALSFCQQDLCIFLACFSWGGTCSMNELGGGSP